MAHAAHLAPSHFESDSEALQSAAFIGAQLDAAAEYLNLRTAYAELKRKGQDVEADALASAAPRILHKLARDGRLAAPKSA